MHENFLHYLWRTRRFDQTDLKTTDGESLEILDFGEYNTHAGPDFLNARIRINDMLWAGNVEIHIKSSDWLQHGHQHDDAYKNVVLHVVYDNDQFVYYKENAKKTVPQPNSGEFIKCLELKKRIPEGIFNKYWVLLHNEHWIPCQHHLYQVSDLVKNACFERVLIERLERKTNDIRVALERNKNDWEETFYQFTARYFGAKENAEPMEWLARSLPHLILAKHKNQLFQIEALLYGQAGLLEKDFSDDYPNALKKEYQFLKHKYQLTPINAVAWKFARLRPANFPTIRIAQLAQLIHQSSHLFSKVIQTYDAGAIKKLFSVTASDYWHQHYIFDTPSVFLNSRQVLADDEKLIPTPTIPHRIGNLGKDTVQLLLINVVIPFLFYYGKNRKEDLYIERAFEYLKTIPSENNAITIGWKQLGIPLESAHRTQALIHLKNEYCDKKRCLDCAIGHSIIGGKVKT